MFSCVHKGWSNVPLWFQRKNEILRGGHDWKVSVASSANGTWRERTWEGGSLSAFIQ